MPVTRSGEHPRFEPAGTHGVVVTSLLSPSRGSIELVLYRISMRPGSTLPVHQHDHEEVFSVLGGSIESIQDGRTYPVGEGDAVSIQAGVVHSARAGEGGAELMVAVPLGTRTLPIEGEPSIPPWGR
jgi:quercetin dioxygenase-like cupin family protein